MMIRIDPCLYLCLCLYLYLSELSHWLPDCRQFRESSAMDFSCDVGRNPVQWGHWGLWWMWGYDHISRYELNMCCNVILWDNCDYSKPVHPPVLGPNIGFWVPCWKIPPPFSLPLHLHLLLRVTLPALRSPKRGACSPGGAPPIPLLLHCRRRPLPLTINWMPTLAVVPLTPRILAWTVPPTPWITTLAVPLILAAVPPSPGLLLQLLHSILECAHLPLQDVPLPADWQTKRTSLLVPVVPHLETQKWTHKSSLTGLYQSFSGTFTKLKSLSCSPRKKQGNTYRTNSAIARLLLNVPVMALLLIVQKRYARRPDMIFAKLFIHQRIFHNLEV